MDVDASKWLHVAVRNSSSLWAVSGSLSNPEAAPIGYVRGERLLSFDVKVNDSATERFTTLELEVRFARFAQWKRSVLHDTAKYAFCRAVTSISSQRLLHPMTNSRQF